MQNKTYLLAGAAVLALNLPAQANELDFNPYVGFDLTRSTLSYEEENFGGGINVDYGRVLEDSLNGLNIHVGNRFNKYFGLELGYLRTQEENKNIANGQTVGSGTVATANFSTDVKLSGFTIDALGYMPVGEQEAVNVIGTAGVSYLKGEASLTVPGVGTENIDESEFGFRVGGGLQYNISDKVNLRGLVRYQTADFEGSADNIWMYSVGLNYSF